LETLDLGGGGLTGSGDGNIVCGRIGFGDLISGVGELIIAIDFGLVLGFFEGVQVDAVSVFSNMPIRDVVGGI
jgi:hypothetical protein